MNIFNEDQIIPILGATRCLSISGNVVSLTFPQICGQVTIRSTDQEEKKVFSDNFLIPPEWGTPLKRSPIDDVPARELNLDFQCEFSSPDLILVHCKNLILEVNGTRTRRYICKAGGM